MTIITKKVIIKENLTQKLSRLLVMEKEHKKLKKKHQAAVAYIDVLEKNSINRIFDRDSVCN